MSATSIMAKTVRTVLTICLSAMGALAQQQAARISQTCPYPGLCFSLNVPDNSGDIHFQIYARTSYQWVALGQGNRMLDSNMFIIWANGAGNNITLSPRQGTAHTTPQYSNHAQLTLLEGTSVTGSWMTANIRCSNCQSWPGGSMDFSAAQADWIYAAKLGEPLRSDDTHRSIHRHDNKGHFQWQLAEARGGSDPNPFLTQAATMKQDGAQRSSVYQQPLSTVDPTSTSKLVLVHGAMAALVFVVLFPIGGILIRLANFRGGIALHVGVQILAWLIALVALGLGIYVAVNMNLLASAHAHPIIGIILLVLILGQPLYGWLHHRAYKAHGRRTIWSWAHLSVGRIAICGGIVNGGLGLQLAGHTDRYYVLRYSIVSGVFFLLYVAAIIYGELRLRKVRPDKRSFAKIGPDRRAGSREMNMADEAGAAVPSSFKPFRLMRDEVLHDADSTEYAPLAAKERYADDGAASRAGSRAASPSPSYRGLSIDHSRSRSTSTVRLPSGAYDP